MVLTVGWSRLFGADLPRDEASGLPGRRAFEADLARAVAGARDGRLTLALIGLDGLDEITSCNGRRWADLQLAAAAGVLDRLAACDRRLRGYRIGVHTLALVFAGVDLDGAFPLAEAARERIERDAEPIMCAVGLATLDGVRAAEAETLELAADAALDQALLLSGSGGGRVVAAADQDSGLRWIASRPASSSSAAP